MRVWDIKPCRLCDRHLLGEHNEIHAIYSALARQICPVTNRQPIGYLNHPETKRWHGKLPALIRRHDVVACEMRRRNFRHASSLPGYVDFMQRFQHSGYQSVHIHTIRQQIKILREKKCQCNV